MPTDAAIDATHARQRREPAPAFADFLPETLRQTLSAEQLAAIEQAAVAWTRARARTLPVDIRLSLPLPFRRLFLTVLAGSDRRGAARRAAERRLRPLATAGNLLVMAFLVSLVYAGLLLAALALSGVVE